VSIAWRLVDLRVWMVLAEPRRCHAEVIELASPEAAPPTAPPTAEAAPVVVNPVVDEYPLFAVGVPVGADGVPPVGPGLAGAGDGAAAAVGAVPVDAGADGLNGARPLLTAVVPLSAVVTEAAEVVTAESADSAVSVCWPVSQSLSPELIVCRLPCRWLPRPFPPEDSDEPAVRPFALPIVSAGSGTLLVDSASPASSSAVSLTTGSSTAVSPTKGSPATESSIADALSAVVTVATSSAVTVSSASSEVAVSPEVPEEEEFPLLAPPTRRDAAERELPALFREDDMMSLSTIVSAVSPSGSTFRLGGAMMSGG
jgi:hypothetical protein